MGEYTTDVYNITNLTLNIRKRSASLNENFIYDVVFSISDENISRLNKFKNRRYASLFVIRNVHNGCTVHCTQTTGIIVLSVCIQILLSVCICLSLSQRMAKKVANGQLEEEDLLVSDLKALLTCTAPV